MADSAHTTSRRSMLSALAIVPLISAVPVSAALHGQIIGELSASGGLPAAIIAWRRAEAAEDAYYQQIYTPAHDRWQAAVAAIPHVEVKIPFVEIERGSWTTAEEAHVQNVRSLLADKKLQEHQPYAEIFAAGRQFLALAAERDAEPGRLREMFWPGARTSFAMPHTPRWRG